MGAYYSDPPFGRGQTAGVDSTQGSSFIGVIKAFTDVHPVTGVKQSNREVTCVAVRNTSGSAITPGSVVKLKAAAVLTEVDGLGDQTSGQLQGVADEYLPAAGVANNDIFWVVVRGPTSVKKTTATATAGSAIGPSTTAGSALGTGSGLGVALETVTTGTPVRAVLTQTHTW